MSVAPITGAIVADEGTGLSSDLDRKIRRLVDEALIRIQTAAAEAEMNPTVEVTAVAGEVRVTRTSFPGLVIGRRGATADDLRSQRAELTPGRSG